MAGNVTIEVSGMKQVQTTLTNFERALPANLKKGMRSAGVILERDMKQKVSGPGRSTAAKSKKGRAAFRNRPAFSRLTQAPGVVTNRLRASIRFALKLKGVITGARVDYDKYLEKGTKNMPAYPFVGPTWKDKGKAALKAIDKAILRPLK